MNIRDEITTYLTTVAEIRGVSSSMLGPDVALMEIGILDSLSLLDFIRFIEQRWSIQICEEEIVLENFGTIAAVTAYLQRRTGAGTRL